MDDQKSRESINDSCKSSNCTKPGVRVSPGYIGCSLSSFHNARPQTPERPVQTLLSKIIELRREKTT